MTASPPDETNAGRRHDRERWLRPRKPATAVFVLTAALVVTYLAQPLARLGVTSGDAATRAIAQLMTFGRPTATGINGIGYEQNLRIDSRGRIYTSVPDGAPSQTSFIWHSTDGGRTFKPVAASLPLTHAIPEPGCSGGGGDTELAVDSLGNLYFNDLTLANFSTSRSSNQGRTLAPNSCLGAPGALVDRQWYAVDGNPTAGGTLYLAYDGVAQGTAACPGVETVNNELELARSPAVTDPTGALAGVAFAPPLAATAPCNEGIMGNVEVSPTTHHIFVVHDDTFYQQMRVARCSKVAFTATAPSGLACTDKLISAFPHAITAANFPSLAIDKAGKLYAVWEQASCGPCGFNAEGLYIGNVTGDTRLFISTSSNDGATWTAPKALSTPGLHNNVFATVAAGDTGRADIAWYGTGATESTTSGVGNGPDSTHGDWGVYVTQTLNGAATFSPPVLASEHVTHRGTIYTLLGGQLGDRALGDFIQLRIGPKGEANISYADSTDHDASLYATQATFVRQNGGPSVLASAPTVKGASAAVNGVTDKACDATLDAAGTVGADMPNLDILASTVSQPDSAHYVITMTVADLRSLAPASVAAGPDLAWQTQWHVPVSTASPTAGSSGGHIFFAYMESDRGAAPTFWVGENSTTGPANGGNGSLTYPGTQQITGSYTATSPGTISITVPAADVSDPAALGTTLFSVTASTMTYPAAPSSENSMIANAGFGGVLFNTIDSAPAYDFVPGSPPPKLSISSAC